MKKYKVLNKDKTSPFKNFKYMLGKEHHVPEIDMCKDNDCSYGLYATDLEGILYSNLSDGKQVYECEVRGKEVVIDQFKQRFEYLKLIRKVPLKELEPMLKKESKKLGYDLYRALIPVNPLASKPNKPTKKDIANLKKWYSVRESVRESVGESVRESVGDSVGYSVGESVWDSVGESVWDSVWNSVWNSVRYSVRYSVRDSVWDSVGAYVSSLFPNIKDWKYIDHKKGINPFQSCIDLWHRGFVPSFDGEIWRLHSGKKAEIVFEIHKDKLREVK